MNCEFTNFNKKVRFSKQSSQRAKPQAPPASPSVAATLLRVRTSPPVGRQASSAFIRRLSDTLWTTSARTSTGVEPAAVTDQRAAKAYTLTTALAAPQLLFATVRRLRLLLVVSVIDVPDITPAVPHFPSATRIHTRERVKHKLL